MTAQRMARRAGPEGSGSDSDVRVRAGATTLFGISNCDQVKKARAWLDARGIAYTFHDFKKHGLTPVLAQEWLDQVGARTLINRKGTTWRGLDDASKNLEDKAPGIVALICAQPSLVKRPVLLHPGTLAVGFDPDYYANLFA